MRRDDQPPVQPAIAEVALSKAVADDDDVAGSAVDDGGSETAMDRAYPSDVLVATGREEAFRGAPRTVIDLAVADDKSPVVRGDAEMIIQDAVGLEDEAGLDAIGRSCDLDQATVRDIQHMRERMLNVDTDVQRPVALEGDGHDKTLHCALPDLRLIL